MTTKTTTKKDGEVVEEGVEKAGSHLDAASPASDKTDEAVDALVNGDGKKEELANKASTLKRGVNFDTPSKGVTSHLGDTSVTCVRLSCAQLTHCESCHVSVASFC